MKIHLDMTGKPLAKPDFAMLRAGLAAAQAGTPTAAASDHARLRADLAEALIRLFGDQAADATHTSVLHGSFNPLPLPDARDDETQR